METSHIVEISRAEEKLIVEDMKKKALQKCNKELQAFGECARGRTVTVAWYCRGLSRILNSCLHQYTDVDTLDAMKIDFLRQKHSKSSSTS